MFEHTPNEQPKSRAKQRVVQQQESSDNLEENITLPRHEATEQERRIAELTLWAREHEPLQEFKREVRDQFSEAISIRERALEGLGERPDQKELLPNSLYEKAIGVFKLESKRQHALRNSIREYDVSYESINTTYVEAVAQLKRDVDQFVKRTVGTSKDFDSCQKFLDHMDFKFRKVEERYKKAMSGAFSIAQKVSAPPVPKFPSVLPDSGLSAALAEEAKQDRKRGYMDESIGLGNYVTLNEFISERYVETCDGGIRFDIEPGSDELLLKMHEASTVREVSHAEDNRRYGLMLQIKDEFTKEREKMAAVLGAARAVIRREIEQ